MKKKEEEVQTHFDMSLAVKQLHHKLETFGIAKPVELSNFFPISQWSLVRKGRVHFIKVTSPVNHTQIHDFETPINP